MKALRVGGMAVVGILIGGLIGLIIAGIKYGHFSRGVGFVFALMQYGCTSAFIGLIIGSFVGKVVDAMTDSGSFFDE
jgi:hypothetical protein